MRFIFLIVLFSSCTTSNTKEIIILISANAEWRVIRSMYPNEIYKPTPWGEYFETSINTKNGTEHVLFFHEGWGKVAAAGATQFAIDQWSPSIMINLGTCGGFSGSIKKFDIVLVDKTLIYDIKEAMGDSEEAIQEYSTVQDLDWLTIPDSIKKSIMVSADKDLVPEEIEMLKEAYAAIAGDWETGAIAYTCARNNVKCIALRGVSDLVSPNGGEAYSDSSVFINGTEVVMKKLLNGLPLWLERIHESQLHTH